MQSPFPSTSPGGTLPQQQQQQQHLQQQIQLFGILAPGAQVRTDFHPVDASGLKHTLALSDLPAPPTSIPDLVFFLLPGAVLPPNHGALLYWQASATLSNHNNASPSETTTGFELLGAITPDRPSGVFRTGWGENELLLTAITSTPVLITLGVSIEPLPNIQNLSLAHKGVEDRMHVAKKVALDLFNYMQSFDDGSGGGRVAGYMTVPNNIFDRWMQRFENKFRRDPNFFLKSSDS